MKYIILIFIFIMSLFSAFQTGNGYINADGGYCIQIKNQTGETSVKGKIVRASDTTTNSVMLCPAYSEKFFGVIYESGKTNGALMQVVIKGYALVLFATNEGATNGQIVFTSSQIGLAIATNTYQGDYETKNKIGITTDYKTNIAGSNILIGVLLN
jgi:hypothetical protein